MDNFNFNLFKNFYYVVLYNGVTNASKNINVAQPSLSLSIKKLEEELNLTLIDRSNYQFKLTEEGEKLFSILKPAFETISENVIFQNQDRQFLELNIGIVNGLADVLSEFIKNFLKKYSNVKINIDLYNKLDDDKVKDYDIIIDDRGYLEKLSDFSLEDLCHVPNYFVCSNKIYDEYKDIKSIKELDGVPLVSYKPSLKMGKFRELCYKNSIYFTEISSVNESDVYFSLVKENVGLGFSNTLLLKKHLKYNSLCILEVEEDIFEDVIPVVYKNNSDISNNFVKMLKKYIEEEVK